MDLHFNRKDGTLLCRGNGALSLCARGDHLQQKQTSIKAVGTHYYLDNVPFIITVKTAPLISDLVFATAPR